MVKELDAAREALVAARRHLVEGDGPEQVALFDLAYMASALEAAAVMRSEVWARDQGRCVECGSSDNLHFDHVIPYPRGGSSLVAENIQLLCARHNLDKGARLA